MLTVGFFGTSSVLVKPSHGIGVEKILCGYLCDAGNGETCMIATWICCSRAICRLLLNQCTHLWSKCLQGFCGDIDLSRWWHDSFPSEYRKPEMNACVRRSTELMVFWQIFGDEKTAAYKSMIWSFSATSSAMISKRLTADAYVFTRF